MSYGMFFDRLPKALIPICKLHGAMVLTQVYWDVKVTPADVQEMLGVDQTTTQKILAQLSLAEFLSYRIEDDLSETIHLTPKAVAYFEPAQLNEEIKKSMEHVKPSPAIRPTPTSQPKSYENLPTEKTVDPDLLVQIKVIQWLKDPEAPLTDELRQEVDRIQTPHIKTFCLNTLKRKVIK